MVSTCMVVTKPKCAKKLIERAFSHLSNFKDMLVIYPFLNLFSGLAMCV